MERYLLEPEESRKIWSAQKLMSAAGNSLYVSLALTITQRKPPYGLGGSNSIRPGNICLP